MKLDFNALTIGEIAKVEELSGTPITAIMQLADGTGTLPIGKPLAALMFVLKKREDHTFTFEKALDLTFAEIQEMFADSEDEAEANLESN